LGLGAKIDGDVMKTIQVEIPEALGKQIDALIQGGWFADDAELTRAALRDFLRRNRPELMERFLQEDIDWALRQKKHRS
jgi:Arc/MetJ-type ribon-helix-helix transcriptional regulator